MYRCLVAADKKDLQAAAPALLQDIAEEYAAEHAAQSDDDIPELAFFYETEEVWVYIPRSQSTNMLNKFYSRNSPAELTKVPKHPEAPDTPFFFVNLCLLFMYQGEDMADSLRDFLKLGDKTPLLVLVDIPEQKKYVHSGKIDQGEVRRLVEKFKKGELELVALR